MTKIPDLSRMLSDGLSMGIIVLDKAHKIIFWNRWMEKHSGIHAKDILEKNIFDAYPDIKERKKDKYILDCIHYRKSFILSPMIHHYLIPLFVVKNSLNICMFQDIKIYPLHEEECPSDAIIIIRNATEQILYEHEIERLNRLLRGIRCINRLIVHANCEDEILTKACGIIVDIIGNTFSGISLLDEKQDKLIPKGWAGIGHKILSYQLNKDQDYPKIFQTTIDTRKTQILNQDDPMFSELSLKMQCEAGCQSVCSMPLIIEDQVIGIFNIHSREKDFYQGEQLELLEQMASDISYGIKSIRDRQKKIEMEESLREHERRRLHIQKIEAIGVLAGGIAHDFNNILFGMMGNIEMALDHIPEENPAREHVKQAFQGTMRAKDLVRQILTFSRSSEVRREPILVSPILKEVLKLLKSTLPTTIEINSHISNDVKAVFADPIQLYQVIINLCTNAFHAMDEKGGVLDIHLSVVEIHKENMPSGANIPFGNYIMLKVSDTGCGMDSKVISRIFEPYFTTKGIGKGTGMGLSLVYGIVMSYGGHIEVSSVPGSGSTFTIYLPQIEPKPNSEIKKQPSIPFGITGRILIVDDEDVIATLLSRGLSRLGLIATSFTGPKKALEAFRRNPDNFDLIITDMTMPGMNGDNLAKQILEIRPDIPIILCTGYNEGISEDKAKKIGIRKFVIKPVSIATLSGVICEILKPAKPE